MHLGTCEAPNIVIPLPLAVFWPERSGALNVYTEGLAEKWAEV